MADICSICEKTFTDTDEYLTHTCTTGFKPNQFEHQVAIDPRFELISQSALERGEAKK
jgi:hypothetical protein